MLVSKNVFKILDQETTVEIIGEKNAIPIVLLHGWGTDKDYFKKLISEISIIVQNKYQFILFDWPGFGESESLKSPWDLNQYSKFLNLILEELNFSSKYYIIGHSFGGSVIIKSMIQNLINPEKIVLCASSGIRKPRSIKKRVFKCLSAPGKLIFKLPILNRFETRIKRIFYHLIGGQDYFKAKDENLKKTLTNIVNNDLSIELKNIQIPTFLLWGKKDSYTPIKHAFFMKEQIPNSQLSVLNQATHALLRTHPKECAQKIIDFLEK